MISWDICGLFTGLSFSSFLCVWWNCLLDNVDVVVVGTKSFPATPPNSFWLVFRSVIRLSEHSYLKATSGREEEEEATTRFPSLLLLCFTINCWLQRDCLSMSNQTKPSSTLVQQREKERKLELAMKVSSLACQAFLSVPPFELSLVRFKQPNWVQLNSAWLAGRALRANQRG